MRNRKTINEIRRLIIAILIDDRTRILVQGITGREAATFTKDMMDYGSKVVAGVTPGKQGQTVHGIPVFDTVKEAVEKQKANAAVVSVPPAFAKDAVMEAADCGLSPIACLTERIPKRDVIEMVAYADLKGVKIIGPNSPGVISPAKRSKLGFLGGNNPERAFRPGHIGVISRSGGMCTEVANLVSNAGMGISTAIGMGGDSVVGSTYLDFFPLFEQDPETHAMVLFCEPGGTKEDVLAEWIPGHFTKPVVAFFGGKFVDNMPGMRFGHASVIVRPGSGATRDKTRLFQQAGVKVVEVYSDIPKVLRELLREKGKAAGKKIAVPRKKAAPAKRAVKKIGKNRKSKKGGKKQ